MFLGFNDLTRCQDSVTFFHIRPNKWGFSLNNLEIDKYLCKSINEFCLIAQVGFPLKSIKFNGIHLHLEMCHLGGHETENWDEYTVFEFSAAILSNKMRE